jgi:hypothetical protein
MTDFICSSTCPTLPTIATLAPGLLSLACLVWTQASAPRVRWAGWVATILAGLRLVVPAAYLLVDGWLHGWSTTISGMIFPADSSGVLSFLLWMITLLAFVGFRSVRRERLPSNASLPGEGPHRGSL